MSAIVQRQSMAAGVLFTGVLPANNPTVSGFVESWLERAQGGAFGPSLNARKVVRIFADLKDALTFTVELYHGFSGQTFQLYNESSPEVTSNVLLASGLELLLAPGDQIRFSATGGTGAHLAELMFDSGAWNGYNPASCT